MTAKRVERIGNATLYLGDCESMYLAKGCSFAESRPSWIFLWRSSSVRSFAPLGEDPFTGGQTDLGAGAAAFSVLEVRETVKREKVKVVGLLERKGRVRPRIVADVTGKTLKQVIAQNVEKSARIMTDDWSGYRGLKKAGWNHESVCHSMYEYARGDVSTNTIEGFFGIVRRGLDGIYHSVSRKHLHRYLGEFTFRYDNRGLSDGQRTVLAIKQSQGKRLRYAETTGST